MSRGPHCQSESRQVRNGTNPSGSQRYKCMGCLRKYTPTPTHHGYSTQLRDQAVKLSVDGVHFRRIARILGVSHPSVMAWVQAQADRLPDPPVPSSGSESVAELDELFTFVGCKKTRSMLSRR